MTDPKAPEPTPVLRLADRILELVRSTTVGGTRGDSAGRFMFSAYFDGYRRLRAVRLLAEGSAGEEAVIVARSLLSLTVRAAYVDAPTDSAERRRRFLQLRAHELREQIKTTRALAAAGVDVDVDVSGQEEELAEIGNVGSFPNDTELMRDHLNLAVFHARLYRPASDHVHFSQQAALEKLQGVDEVDIDAGDAALADEGLRLSIITYGLLLERSERTVQHGLAARVLELARTVLESSAES